MRWIALIWLALSSCTPVYLSGVRNVPVFEKKGEVQVSSYVGFTSGSGDLDLNLDGNVQVAWAPINHVAVTGSFLYLNHRERSYSRFQRATDIAVGFYKTGRVYIDCFFGYGHGQGTAKNFSGGYLYPSAYSSGTYQRLSIQPSVAVNEKRFTFSYTSRFSWIDFKTFESDPDQQLDAKLIWEPCFTARMRLAPSVYPTIQFGFNLAFQSQPFFEYTRTHIAMGVCWKPSELWQK